MVSSPPRTLRLAGEIRANLGLAAPLIAMHLGQQSMHLVDSAMLGRLGNAAQAGAGIGGNLFWAVLALGVGLMLGLDPLVSQAVGAGEPGRARRLLDRGMRLGLRAGLPLLGLALLAPVLLGVAGVEAETAAEARRYMWARAPGVIPFLLGLAVRSYLQASGAGTRPILISVAVGNAVNVLGNVVLIFGDRGLSWLGLPAVGLPALGTVGCGLATAIGTVAGLGVLLLGLPERGRPERWSEKDEAGADRAMLRLGLPIGLSILAEVGVFAVASLMAGRLGQLAATGHTIALSVASFTFSVAMGIGASTSVRVGQSVGAGGRLAARRAGLAGLTVIWAYMAGTALLMLVWPAQVAARLNPAPSAIDASVPLLMIAALFQLSDGTQCVSAGALRGAGDTRVPMLANVMGHYLVGVPVAIGLAFGLDLGARGLWWGLSAGLTAVAVALLLRFLALTGREVARVELSA